MTAPRRLTPPVVVAPKGGQIKKHGRRVTKVFLVHTSKVRLYKLKAEYEWYCEPLLRHVGGETHNMSKPDPYLAEVRRQRGAARGTETQATRPGRPLTRSPPYGGHCSPSDPATARSTNSALLPINSTQSYSPLFWFFLQQNYLFNRKDMIIIIMI